MSDLIDTIVRQQGHEPCDGVEHVRDLAVREVDGFRQRLDVFRPADPGARRTGALLYLHGGGFQGGDPPGAGHVGKLLALRLGMTTFSFSYRLASPGNPTYPKPLDDVAAGWEWIRQNAADWQVDPQRVAAGGESAGACLATLALVTGLLPGAAALVNLWGPIDFVARWFDNGENPGAERILLGCTYTDNPGLYHQASALTHVRPGLPPALFIYGRQDPIVHARQGRLGLAAWTRAGSHAEFYAYNNIGHGVVGDNSDEMKRVLAKTGDFIAARL